MLWKKGNERFALLIVAVVAVFGLVMMFNNSWNDGDSFTGFAAKKAVAKAEAPAKATTTKAQNACREKQIIVHSRCPDRSVKSQSICKNGKYVRQPDKQCPVQADNAPQEGENAAPQEGENAAPQKGENAAPREGEGATRAEGAAPPQEPFCRPGASWDIVNTQEGIRGPVCDPATGNFIEGYRCENNQAVPRSSYSCGDLGCNNELNNCCRQASERRSFCEGRTVVNETVSACDGQRRTTRISCEQLNYNPLTYQRGEFAGTCVPAVDNVVGCLVCGVRGCYSPPQQYAPAYLAGIRPEEQCHQGQQDLGIVQC